ncbi:MAG: FKBP-type peptidyl-prolyl cis-trans isomerase N-terminal domain-containing protein [Pseudomonadales bacterium]
MKIRTLAIATVAVTSVLALSACKDDKAAAASKDAAAPAATAAASTMTQAQKVSYILGMNIGSQFKANQVTLDESSFVAGMKTAIDGSEPKLNKDEMQKAMQHSLKQKCRKKQEEAQKAEQAKPEAESKKNKEEGDKFLAENGKAGVTTTKSGIQYEVLTEGSGVRSQRNRYRHRGLCRHADRRQRIRQLNQARRTGNFCGERSDSWLARSVAVDAYRSLWRVAIPLISPTAPAAQATVNWPQRYAGF